MSFRGSEASRGIFPSGRFYLVLVLLPTWWIPPLRFAAVGMTKRGDVFRYYRKQFRPFWRGTAHRPFPTVRLGLFTFAPAVSTMRNVALPVFRTTAVVKHPNQRNRRERPVCRSGGVANTTRADERNHSPPCHPEGIRSETVRICKKQARQVFACRVCRLYKGVASFYPPRYSRSRTIIRA